MNLLAFFEIIILSEFQGLERKKIINEVCILGTNTLTIPYHLLKERRKIKNLASTHSMLAQCCALLHVTGHRKKIIDEAISSHLRDESDKHRAIIYKHGYDSLSASKIKKGGTRKLSNPHKLC